jgi:hypothetical protein
MAVTTSASIGDVVDTVIAEARRTQMHRTVMEPLVRTYRVPRGAGDQLEIPKFGTVTANALAEGVDMANPQTLTTTKVVVTPAEVGAQVVITDRALRTVREDMARLDDIVSNGGSYGAAEVRSAVVDLARTVRRSLEHLRCL